MYQSPYNPSIPYGIRAAGFIAIAVLIVGVMSSDYYTTTPFTEREDLWAFVAIVIFIDIVMLLPVLLTKTVRVDETGLHIIHVFFPPLSKHFLWSEITMIKFTTPFLQAPDHARQGVLVGPQSDQTAKALASLQETEIHRIDGKISTYRMIQLIDPQQVEYRIAHYAKDKIVDERHL